VNQMIKRLSLQVLRVVLFTVFLALSYGSLVGVLPLLAHHGNAAFDTTKTLTMKGTVVEWVWANPHCWLKFDVKDESGNVAHWTAETSNPPDMVNRGWSKSSFRPGDEITVTVIPVKNGQPIGTVQQVVLPNGQTLVARPQPAPKPATEWRDHKAARRQNV
jgi:hypothetical protein